MVSNNLDEIKACCISNSEGDIIGFESVSYQNGIDVVQYTTGLKTAYIVEVRYNFSSNVNHRIIMSFPYMDKTGQKLFSYLWHGLEAKYKYKKKAGTLNTILSCSIDSLGMNISLLQHMKTGKKADYTIIQFKQNDFNIEFWYKIPINNIKQMLKIILSCLENTYTRQLININS